jgi:branched-chain amino acid transport system ATP-binding protein
VSALLRVSKLNKSFGSVIAASDINVAVADTEIVGIIGANGAGKTSFVNLVTGYLKPTSGTIEFMGRDITALPPRHIIAAGISRSFQVPQVFASASVFDNLLIACGITAAPRFPLWRPLRRPDLAAAAEALVERFGLDPWRDRPAQLLPQGVRKLLDIAMAIVRVPRLLLLDEPTSGISAEEKFAVMDLVMAALRHQSIAVMFIEHDMEIIGRHARRVLAFADGTIIAEGEPETVLANPQVKRIITGERAPLRVVRPGARP